MDKFLDFWQDQKKDKHGNHCQKRRKHFYLFVISVDEMIGKDDLILLENLSQLIAAKMDEPISLVRGWIKVLIEIAVVRSYSQMIRKDQPPSPLRYQETDWDLSSGLDLAQ